MSVSVPNPARLQALMDLLQASQAEVAASLGISQPTLSKIVRRELPFTDDLVAVAADHYRMPPGFFTVPDSRLELAVPTFRKYADAGVRVEKRVIRLYREAARLTRLVLTDSGYPEFQAARYARDDVEQAAAEVRSAAGLAPMDPVGNMARLLERLGVAVITRLDSQLLDLSPEERRKLVRHSGVSAPQRANTRPVSALVAPLPGAVARFTLAHELAHQIFDPDLTQAVSTRSPEETRAHDFAGALLLPRRGAAHLDDRSTLSDLADLKATWGISIAAALQRGRRLGLISEARARSLQIQISSRGWRNDEPVDVPEEEPMLLRQALTRVVGTSALAIADYASLPADMVQGWVGAVADETTTTATVTVLRPRGQRR